MYHYKAKVLRVVDGDTVELEVDLGFETRVRKSFRILSLDTYETRLIRGTTQEQKDIGLLAKEFATKLLEGKTVFVETQKKDKYGRWLCRIWIAPKGIRVASVADCTVDYSKVMVDLGFDKNFDNFLGEEECRKLMENWI